MHLICPPPPPPPKKKNWKQCFCIFFLGGGGEGVHKVHHGKCGSGVCTDPRLWPCTRKAPSFVKPALGKRRPRTQATIRASFFRSKICPDLLPVGTGSEVFFYINLFVTVRTSIHFFVNFAVFQWLYVVPDKHQTWGLCKSRFPLSDFLAWVSCCLSHNK